MNFYSTFKLVMRYFYFSSKYDHHTLDNIYNIVYIFSQLCIVFSYYTLNMAYIKNYTSVRYHSFYNLSNLKYLIIIIIFHIIINTGFVKHITFMNGPSLSTKLLHHKKNKMITNKNKYLNTAHY